MIVVVDGNDGTGKSTLVRALQARGVAAVDRGAPTRMTDDPAAAPAPGEAYLILDVPVEVSRARLAAAGKDLGERYHTVADLTHYRERFRAVAAALGDRAVLVDASGTPEETLEAGLRGIARLRGGGAGSRPQPPIRWSVPAPVAPERRRLEDAAVQASRAVTWPEANGAFEDALDLKDAARAGDGWRLRLEYTVSFDGTNPAFDPPWRLVTVLEASVPDRGPPRAPRIVAQDAS